MQPFIKNAFYHGKILDTHSHKRPSLLNRILMRSNVTLTQTWKNINDLATNFINTRKKDVHKFARLIYYIN